MQTEHKHSSLSADLLQSFPDARLYNGEAQAYSVAGMANGVEFTDAGEWQQEARIYFEGTGGQRVYYPNAFFLARMDPKDCIWLPGADPKSELERLQVPIPISETIQRKWGDFYLSRWG